MKTPDEMGQREFQEMMKNKLSKPIAEMLHYRGHRIAVFVLGEVSEKGIAQIDCSSSTLELREHVISFIREYAGDSPTPQGISGYVSCDKSHKVIESDFWLNEHGIAKRGVCNKPPESHD